MSVQEVSISVTESSSTPPEQETGILSRWGRRITEIGSAALPVLKTAGRVMLVVGIIGLACFLLVPPAPSSVPAQPVIQKRHAEQTPPVRYTAMPKADLFPEIPTQSWRAGSLCVADTEGVFVGIDSTYDRHVKLFDVAGGSLQLKQAASQAITSQLPLRSGGSDVRVGCKPGNYHYTVLDTDTFPGTAMTYHTAITNQSVAVPEQLASGGPATQARAIKPIPLQGRQAAIVETLGPSYVAKYSDSSGALGGTSSLQTIFSVSDTSIEGKVPEPITFDDGSFTVLQARNTAGLFETPFNTSRAMGATTEVNSGQTVDPVYAPASAIPKTATTGSVISQDAVYTFDLSSLTKTAERLFSPGPSSAFSVANCGSQFPTVNWYARQVGTTVYFDLMRDGVSLLGGEQTLNYTSPTIRDVEIGCAQDGTGVITFLEQTASSIPIRLDDPIPPPQTPTPTPAAPTPPPSPVTSSTPPSVQNGTLSITVDPAAIGINFAPISAVVHTGPNITTIVLRDIGGSEIVFTANCTPVPRGSSISVSQGPTWEVRWNGTSHVPPTFDGCTEDRSQCVPSTVLFRISPTGEDGVDWTPVGIGLGVAGAFVVVAAVIFGLVVYRKDHKKNLARKKNEFDRPAARERGIAHLGRIARDERAARREDQKSDV